MTDISGASESGGSASGTGVPTPLPLAGIRVVEIAQNIAGPYAGEILASLGAEVLKVERPEGGDDARGWGPPFWKGMATTFHAMNGGKRGITLDLKDPEAIAWLKDFIGDCDVLVQNLRPGVMDELGLDSATLLELNPRLVYCSLWAFGHTGPMHLKPGYEPMIQAFAGMFSVNGSEDGPPARVGMQVLDLGTGVWAALGCIAALFRRNATGRGGVVDTSLFETALGWLSVHFAGFNVTGEQPKRHRSGNPRVVVFQSFETSDGEIVVAAANDRLFAKLARELGHPEWAQDPRFASNALRVEHKTEVIPRIEAILRTASTEHWVQRLEAIGVPCAPIHDLKQVTEQAQTEALEIFQEIPGVDLKLVGLPVSFDGARPPVRHRAPELGEHNGQFGLAPIPAHPNRKETE
jgi:crotonobetainyl-CoA:carnitine CoA-transferase CaiB-like acyl-CoA transferase